MFIWFLFFFFHFSFVSFLFLFFFCSFFSFFLYLFISLSPVVYGLWSLGAIVKGQACTSKWKTQAQAIGAAENFQSHGILMCDSSPKGLYLNTKMRSHPKSSKLQCRCFMLNHSKIGAELILVRSKPVWLTGYASMAQKAETPAPWKTRILIRSVNKKKVIEKFVKGKIGCSHLHSHLSQPGDHPSGEIWTRKETNKENGQVNKSKTWIISKSLHIKA